ncbi:hypothetical protein NDU88_000888 [Pleurodeles waltl]|uniref:Uncharacterized protein n=1 Tax=Pleurodeles waltl TaxID=8319 RepID=A0AAV7NBW9_PLEWA|nr:hypothetical protein NDU88_000888 [Pleurodeles waltl]
MCAGHLPYHFSPRHGPPGRAQPLLPSLAQDAATHPRAPQFTTPPGPMPVQPGTSGSVGRTARVPLQRPPPEVSSRVVRGPGEARRHGLETRCRELRDGTALNRTTRGTVP